MDGIVLAFHWMVPGYTSEGGLDYDTMLSALLQWLQSHGARDGDILLIQTGVHDIHLGDLAEYPSNTLQLLRFLTIDAPVKLRLVFRSVDAVHVPRGGRSVVERGKLLCDGAQAELCVHCDSQSVPNSTAGWLYHLTLHRRTQSPKGIRCQLHHDGQ